MRKQQIAVMATLCAAMSLVSTSARGQLSEGAKAAVLLTQYEVEANLTYTTQSGTCAGGAVARSA